MDKILITGATGFIGSHVVKLLLSKGYNITVLARNKNKIPELLEHSNCTVVEADLSDKQRIKDVLPGHNGLIHIALFWGHTATDMLMNDTYTSVWLFENAAKCGVKNIIFTSSTAVHDWVYMTNEGKELGGQANNIYIGSKQNPVTFYGATKASAELYLQAIAHQYSITANNIRPGYTFGNPAFENAPTQPDTRFGEIVHKAINDETIVLEKNDGTQFIWADDLAQIYLAVYERGHTNRTYFGLGTTFIRWSDIVETLGKILNKNIALTLQDTNRPEEPALFDVSDIFNDFSLEFSGNNYIESHLQYFIDKEELGAK